MLAAPGVAAGVAVGVLGGVVFVGGAGCRGSWFGVVEPGFGLVWGLRPSVELGVVGVGAEGRPPAGAGVLWGGVRLPSGPGVCVFGVRPPVGAGVFGFGVRPSLVPGVVGG
ncbi:hypothetical protein, partial [Streptomyces chryseus]|uniref:hypothetical protein n=1 Tax=Streptomyces chryseus TaxID=68186 RepID=UPI001B86B39B